MPFFVIVSFNKTFSSSLHPNDHEGEYLKKKKKKAHIRNSEAVRSQIINISYPDDLCFLQFHLMRLNAFMYHFINICSVLILCSP